MYKTHYVITMVYVENCVEVNVCNAVTLNSHWSYIVQK